MVIIILIPVAMLQAQEKSTAELAKAAQNPIANIMKVSGQYQKPLKKYPNPPGFSMTKLKK